jgi:hypothetical protein
VLFQQPAPSPSIDCGNRHAVANAHLFGAIFSSRISIALASRLARAWTLQSSA